MEKIMNLLKELQNAWDLIKLEIKNKNNEQNNEEFNEELKLANHKKTIVTIENETKLAIAHTNHEINELVLEDDSKRFEHDKLIFEYGRDCVEWAQREGVSIEEFSNKMMFYLGRKVSTINDCQDIKHLIPAIDNVVSNAVQEVNNTLALERSNSFSLARRLEADKIQLESDKKMLVLDNKHLKFREDVARQQCIELSNIVSKNVNSISRFYSSNSIREKTNAINDLVEAFPVAVVEPSIQKIVIDTRLDAAANLEENFIFTPNFTTCCNNNGGMSQLMFGELQEAFRRLLKGVGRGRHQDECKQLLVDFFEMNVSDGLACSDNGYLPNNCIALVACIKRIVKRLFNLKHNETSNLDSHPTLLVWLAQRTLAILNRINISELQRDNTVRLIQQAGIANLSSDEIAEQKNIFAMKRDEWGRLQEEYLPNRLRVLFNLPVENPPPIVRLPRAGKPRAPKAKTAVAPEARRRLQTINGNLKMTMHGSIPEVIAPVVPQVINPDIN